MRPPAGGRQYIYWHPSLRPPLRPYLGNVAKLIRRRRISLKRDNHPQNPSVKSMGARLEQKISLQHKVVTTKPTQVNLLNVVNTQTFSELIHERLNILYLLNILYTAFLINPTPIAFFFFTLLGLVAFLSKVLITHNFQSFT